MEINKKGDPPEKIMYDGSTFYLEISGGGFYYEEGNPLSSKLLKWDYADEKSERFLSIEQWEKTSLKPLRISAEEYQFSNITPESFCFLLRQSYLVGSRKQAWGKIQ